ncbi:N-formylglutamate deformylase [Pseudorhodobacter sp. MZDSW-24AT]|uniref:N-formylglutamate deformylase n=1 Tax=Pseudorhodobacter sp. MZDSW-24AT TaxID=2052957 RepID=UPI000C1F7618|nr:N-formylglutamate deformylase [Pseudorhodobacter sp. MZDSW-24AT]PJF10147.1 N-formylglutamate deformylase [Pseudorhodobacter sp. MZDSW-24AT]
MGPVVEEGDGPIILAFPHVGTGVPPEVAARLNAEGRVLRDTDWHIHRLYAGLIPGLTTVRATQSRYVIDLNRDPEGVSLYPGQATTGLIPDTTFDNVPIWEVPPGPADVARWLMAVHRPYHASLAAQVARVRARHGVAVVYDCHSIRSRCPWLFDGVLPDLNIGTNGGVTCAPELEAAVCRVAAASGRTWVLNGRFKGGWTTRHHGRPEAGVHAIQMELAQASHLEAEAPPFALDPARAAELRRTLTEILATLADLAPRQAHA